jgi:hypothetical protein
MGDASESDAGEKKPKSSKGIPVAVALVGCLGFCFFASVIGAAISLPGLIASRQRANESNAASALWTVSQAELLHHATKGKSYATLAQLVEEQLLEAQLSSGASQGYLFQAAPSTTSPEELWWGVARPQVPGTTGSRVFYTNQSGVIYDVPFAGGEHDPGLPDPKTCEPPKGSEDYRGRH